VLRFVRFVSMSAVACLLCACAANNQQGWTKEGASPSDFDKDSQVCMRNNENRPTGLRSRDVNEESYDGCLASRGWARNGPK
jgi:Flp pilus assembly protein TadD